MQARLKDMISERNNVILVYLDEWIVDRKTCLIFPA